MNRILNVLRTPGAMLVALVLALIAQLEHTAQVFSAVVGAQGVWSQVHAYIFAISVETAVLLFVLAGHKRISYGFAIATAATNLSYYAMHGIDLLSIAAIPAWLMSLLLPAAIVGYSHTIAETSPATHEPEANDEHAPTSAETSADGTAANAADHLQTPEVDAANLQPEPLQSALVDAPPTSAISTAKPAPKPAPKRRNRKPAKLTPEQRRAQIAESGMTEAGAVAAQFSIALRTAHADLAAVRRATLSANGVQR